MTADLSTYAGILQFIAEELERIMGERGETVPELTDGTLLLGGDLKIDSLDLAVLVVSLGSGTGRDPFKDGFVNFQTVGELARLYTTPE